MSRRRYIALKRKQRGFLGPMRVPVLQGRGAGPGIGSGVGGGAIGGGGSGTSTPSFSLALQATLLPERSNGSGVPTFSRASAAEHIDFEGIHRQTVSGAFRPQGARYVRNQSGTSSEGTTAITQQVNVTVAAAAGITAPAGVTAGSVVRLTSTTVSSSNLARNNATIAGGVASKTIVISYWIMAVTPGSANLFRMGNSQTTVGDTFSSDLTATGIWQRVSLPRTNSSSAGNGTQLNAIYAPASGAVFDVYVAGFQIEDVTSQTNQAPSEYVPSLATANADSGAIGVRFFSTLNGNVVASNIVTESQGPAISSSRAECAAGVTAGVVDASGPLGYLAEGARTNLTFPSVPDASNWGAFPTGADASITANSTASFDGTTTAALLFEKATTAIHGTFHAANTGLVSAANGIVYTAHWWAKKKERTKIRVGVGTVALVDGAYAEFDLNAGTILTNATTFSACVPVANSAFITPAVNGFYHIGFSFTGNAATAAAAFNVALILNAAGAVSYLGDGTSGLYIAADQREAASFASSYIPTTTVAVTRAADVLTYPAAGNFSDAQGSAYAEASRIPWTGAADATGAIVGKTSTGPLVSFSDNSGVVANDGATYAFGPTGTPSGSSLVKGGSTWSGSTFAVFVNGVKGADAVYDGSFNLTNIGIAAGTYFGTIRNVRLYPQPLSAARMVAMTTP